MAKRPSLFGIPAVAETPAAEPAAAVNEAPAPPARSARPPSREGKRVLSIYLTPLAWKQLRQLALQEETTTQALGEEAINLLFSQRGLNRSA